MSATKGKHWSDWTDPVTVAKRAYGRRLLNYRRGRRVRSRLYQVAKVLAELGFQRGLQAEIARQLGVNRSTICRDMWLLFAIGDGVTLRDALRAQRKVGREARHRSRLQSLYRSLRRRYG